MKTIQLTQKKEKVKSLIIFISLTLLFLVSFSRLDLDFAKFSERFSNAPYVLSKFAALNFSDFGTILTELLISICMAISALFIGAIFSFFLSLFAAKNIAPNQTIAAIIKGFISIIRAVPSLVWILMIVASLGFGSTAGVVGLIFPTVGYLTKSFVSSIEDQSDDCLEMMKSTGASWGQTIVEGVLPCVATSFLSWIAIRLESNLAESISLGMVGAGGIGTLLTRAIGRYDYALISTIILTIFLTMFCVELFVGKIKKNIQKTDS